MKKIIALAFCMVSLSHAFQPEIFNIDPNLKYLDTILLFSINQPDSFQQWMDTNSYKIKVTITGGYIVYAGDTVNFNIETNKGNSPFTNSVNPSKYILKSDTSMHDMHIGTQYDKYHNAYIEPVKIVFNKIGIGTITFAGKWINIDRNVYFAGQTQVVVVKKETTNVSKKQNTINIKKDYTSTFDLLGRKQIKQNRQINLILNKIIIY